MSEREQHNNMLQFLSGTTILLRQPQSESSIQPIHGSWNEAASRGKTSALQLNDYTGEQCGASEQLSWASKTRGKQKKRSAPAENCFHWINTRRSTAGFLMFRYWAIARFSTAKIETLRCPLHGLVVEFDNDSFELLIDGSNCTAPLSEWSQKPYTVSTKVQLKDFQADARQLTWHCALDGQWPKLNELKEVLHSTHCTRYAKCNNSNLGSLQWAFCALERSRDLVAAFAMLAAATRMPPPHDSRREACPASRSCLRCCWSCHNPPTQHIIAFARKQCMCENAKLLLWQDYPLQAWLPEQAVQGLA